MRKQKHIVSFSGGKDSTAMLLRMIELDMPIDKIIFADTTLEYPELYDYIKKVEKYIKRKITIVKPEYDLDHYFYKKRKSGRLIGQIRGFPFVITPCWIQRDMKVRVMEKLQSKGDYVYLGYAKGEENRIQTDKTKKQIYKYPLIEWGWTERKCLFYIKEKGLDNPLYRKYKRLGCWLCPKQPTKDLRYIFENHPKLWQKLLRYEVDSPHGFKPNLRLKDLENKWKYQTKLTGETFFPSERIIAIKRDSAESPNPPTADFS